MSVQIGDKKFLHTIKFLTEKKPRESCTLSHRKTPQSAVWLVDSFWWALYMVKVQLDRKIKYDWKIEMFFLMSTISSIWSNVVFMWKLTQRTDKNIPQEQQNYP